jgi:hypothetical protein
MKRIGVLNLLVRDIGAIGVVTRRVTNRFNGKAAVWIEAEK